MAHRINAVNKNVNGPLVLPVPVLSGEKCRDEAAEPFLGERTGRVAWLHTMEKLAQAAAARAPLCASFSKANYFPAQECHFRTKTTP